MLATNILLFILIIIQVIPVLTSLLWASQVRERERKYLKEQEDMLTRVNKQHLVNAQKLMEAQMEQSKTECEKHE